MAETEEGFLGAIAAAPHDDAPRLRFADWLLERGDPRGEFVRGQCELLKLAPHAAEREPLERRVAELLKVRTAECLAALRPLGVRDVRFDRGFIDRIDVDGTQFIDRGRTMQAWAPALRGVKLRPTSGADLGAGVKKLLSLPRFATVTALDLSACSVSRREIEQLAGSDGLARVVTLNLGRNLLSGEPMRTFGQSPHLKALETLRLPQCQLSAHDVAWLAQSESMRSLRRLDVSQNGIGDEGFQTLVCSKVLAGLEELNAAKNDIGAEGVRSFATNSPIKALQSLNLADNWIGDTGATLLATSSNCARLVALNLDRCGIDADAEQSLRASRHLSRVENLSIAPSPTRRPRL